MSRLFLWSTATRRCGPGIFQSGSRSPVVTSQRAKCGGVFSSYTDAGTHEQHLAVGREQRAAVADLPFRPPSA